LFACSKIIFGFSDARCSLGLVGGDKPATSILILDATADRASSGVNAAVTSGGGGVGGGGRAKRLLFCDSLTPSLPGTDARRRSAAPPTAAGDGSRDC
jgi:hypothetical protein